MRASEGVTQVMGRFEVTLMAGVIAVALVGVALLPLTTRPVVRALVASLHTERDTGLSVERTLEMTDRVLEFVTRTGAPDLPSRVEGRDGFDAQAVSHLLDVRSVLIPARWVALALGAVSAAWVCVRRRSVVGRRAVGAASSGGAALVLGGGVLLAIAGAVDFDRVFTAFHGLFFAPGTWVFPDDALLIQLLPLRFWITAGALWAGLAIVLATGTLIIAYRFGSTRGR